MSQRYCIGCVHLNYDAGSPGYDTECTAGIGAEPASMSCSKRHWSKYLYDGGDMFDLEQAMLHAAPAQKLGKKIIVKNDTSQPGFWIAERHSLDKYLKRPVEFDV